MKVLNTLQGHEGFNKFDLIGIDSLKEFIVNRRERLFLIGENHSLTYFSFREVVGEKGLILFDSFSDSCFIYLNKLIEEGFLKASNVIVVGVRGFSDNKVQYLKTNKIVYFDMNKIIELGIVEVCDLVMERMNTLGKSYLSIDLDVLDPAFSLISGEIGGMSSAELIYFLHRIKNMRNLEIVGVTGMNKDNLLVERIIKEFS